MRRSRAVVHQRGVGIVRRIRARPVLIFLFLVLGGYQGEFGEVDGGRDGGDFAVLEIPEQFGKLVDDCIPYG